MAHLFEARVTEAGTVRAIKPAGQNWNKKIILARKEKILLIDENLTQTEIEDIVGYTALKARKNSSEHLNKFHTYKVDMTGKQDQDVILKTAMVKQ